MNSFSKVLVVFILVLSAGFAVSQMILHARRIDYQKKYEDAAAKLADSQKSVGELEEAKRSLTAKADELDKDKADLQRGLEEAKRVRDSQIEELRLEKTRLQAGFDQQRVQTNSLVAMVEEKNGQIDNLKNSVAQLDLSLRAEMQKVKGLEDDQVAKAKQIDQLKGSVAQLTMEKQNLQDSKTKYETILANLKQRGVAILPEDPPPPVDGKVVMVDEQVGAMVINKGKNDKVQVAHSFTIYREDKALAKVTVVEVEDDFCVAQIESPPGLFDKQNRIIVGDSATTRVW